MVLLRQDDDDEPPPEVDPKTRALVRIQTSARGRLARKAYKKKKAAAVTIQRADRRRALKHDDANKVGTLNVIVIKNLIRKLESGNQTQFRNHLADDFDYERQMGGHAVRSRSLVEFLNSPFGKRPLPKPSKVYTPLQPLGNEMVIREVRYALTDVKEAFTIRRFSSGRPPLVCRHSTIQLDEPPEPPPDAEAGAAGHQRLSEAARQDLTSLASLRRSFSVLDVDGSGHLSLDELRRAMRTCGLTMSERELKEQLHGLPIDASGGFELTSLDTVLRQDAVLVASGIDYARPVIFEMLPLISRTFDAHYTVEARLREARLLDRRRDHEHQLALRRIGSSKKHMKLLVESPLMKLAGAFGGSQPKWPTGNAEKEKPRASHFLPPKPSPPPGAQSGLTARERGQQAKRRRGPLPPIHVPGVPGVAPMRYADAHLDEKRGMRASVSLPSLKTVGTGAGAARSEKPPWKPPPRVSLVEP